MVDTMLIFLTCLFSYILWKITSKEQNKIKYHGKFLFYYIYASLIAGLLLPIYLLNPGNTKNARIAASFSGLLTYLFDIEFVLRNEHILAEDRGAVVVANHQSSLDIIGMFRHWNIAQKMTAVAKKELYRYWPFGLACRLAGIVFIDRSQPQAAYKSMQDDGVLHGLHVMQDNKSKMLVFPEGTRNTNINQFLPFKKGAFVMAVAAQVPVIPIVFSPYYFVNKNKNIFARGRIIMQCLEPVPTKGLSEKDIPDLVKTVREKMFTTFRELRKEVLNSLPEDYPYAVDSSL